MNKIVMSLILLLSVVSYAGGGGGGGGGVRPGMGVFMVNSAVELTGVGGGGGGVHPSGQDFMDPSREFVKTLDVGSSGLTVLYKPLGKTRGQTLHLPLKDLNPEYSELLLKSWNENSWVELE